MTSLESMINKLAPLCVYDLSEESTVYGELAAFSEGLDMLRSSIEELLRESFIATAEDYGIESLERLVGNVRNELSTTERRNMLTERFSFGSGDFTLEGFKRMLRLLGTDGEIEEYPLSQRMVLFMTDKEYSDPERQWIVSQAKALLPAHLECDVIFSGFDWEEIEVLSLTFAQMDAKGLAWDDIDYIV